MPIYTDFSTADKTVTDAAAINNSIRNILFTPKGSLPGKPEFGSELYGVIFSQSDHITEDLAERIIREALTVQETRISLRRIKVTSVYEFNKIVIDIDYTYRDKGLDINEQFSETFVR